MITEELKAMILRYYYVEHWRVGTIRRQLKVHPDTVRRVLAQEGVPVKKILPRSSKVEPYLPFVFETLKKFPNLSSARLYRMADERGYRGDERHFRRVISFYRPRPAAEAYLRLKTLAGEQAQADWAHFGHCQIGEAKRPLVAFVMTLSFSRKIFVRFYFNQRLANFLDGHESAFQWFCGVPRVVLVDNLKSAVIERYRDIIHFNEALLKFSAHYRFEVRPVAIARGNEKGRVERSIRYIRGNFFMGRTWKDLNDLNAQAMQWCEGAASERLCPENNKHSVQEMFLQEQRLLLPLPNNPYSIEEREEVRVGKTPYVRFDLNDYSIPHGYVQRTLTVLAKGDRICILNGIEKIAEHQRSYDKGKRIEDLNHIQGLVDFKRKASQHAGQDILSQAAPSCCELLGQAVKRGYALRSVVKQLLLLLEGYGAAELEAAIEEALLKGVPHPNAVRLSLERRREARHQSLSIRLELPEDNRLRQQVIHPHPLNSYDVLHNPEDISHE